MNSTLNTQTLTSAIKSNFIKPFQTLFCRTSKSGISNHVTVQKITPNKCRFFMHNNFKFNDIFFQFSSSTHKKGENLVIDTKVLFQIFAICIVMDDDDVKINAAESKAFVKWKKLTAVTAFNYSFESFFVCF